MGSRKTTGTGLVCAFTTTGRDGERKHRGALGGYKCVKKTKEKTLRIKRCVVLPKPGEETRGGGTDTERKRERKHRGMQ